MADNSDGEEEEDDDSEQVPLKRVSPARFTESIQVKFTPEDWQRILHYSNLLGMKPSQLVRLATQLWIARI